MDQPFEMARGLIVQALTYPFFYPNIEPVGDFRVTWRLFLREELPRPSLHPFCPKCGTDLALNSQSVGLVSIDMAFCI